LRESAINDKRRVTISKYLSRHLRHHPKEIGLTLEPGGWVTVADLLKAAGKQRFPIAPVELAEVVSKCDKQRFAFDDTGLKIRANQGHSTAVDIPRVKVSPPDTLFHGTAARNESLILAGGLLKMSRHHVHLSADPHTARLVGARHGKPLLFVIESARMAADGFAFFRSENGVWLTDHVPPAYLRIESEIGTR